MPVGLLWPILPEQPAFSVSLRGERENAKPVFSVFSRQFWGREEAGPDGSKSGANPGYNASAFSGFLVLFFLQEICNMSVAKVVEIKSSSKKSFEDAVQNGIKRAAKTIDGIRGAWVAEQEVCVENGKVTEYRVLMKVTFVLK